MRHALLALLVLAGCPRPRPAPLVDTPTTSTSAPPDGIPDDKDRCPDEAETVNGKTDGDGCPD